MVGRVSTMRVSSVTRPCSSSGTLKSTRMNTRRFFRSRSRMESLAMSGFACASETFLTHKADHVAHAAGVAPLVVVPGDHLDAISGDDASHRSVDDGRARVTAVIHRDQLGGFVSQITFQWPLLTGLLERGIHFLNRCFLFDKYHHVDEGNIRRGHTE